MDECNCHRCQMIHAEKEPFFFRTMCYCSICGNKRCPKGSDHRLDCTNSNEPDQPGSIY